MPIYLYKHIAPYPHTALYGRQCRKPEEFEIEQKITEDKLRQCPDCEADIERLIADGSSFKFKGGAPTAKTYR